MSISIHGPQPQQPTLYTHQEQVLKPTDNPTPPGAHHKHQQPHLARIMSISRQVPQPLRFRFVPCYLWGDPITALMELGTAKTQLMSGARQAWGGAVPLSYPKLPKPSSYFPCIAVHEDYHAAPSPPPYLVPPRPLPRLPPFPPPPPLPGLRFLLPPQNHPTRVGGSPATAPTSNSSPTWLLHWLLKYSKTK